MKNILIKNLTYIAWLQALVATIGSLYLSEVQRLVPCVLCWYQRICLFPLVIILGVALIRKDKNVPYIALPLSLIGASIALFHYLLQQGIIPDELAPCQAGISCTTKYIEFFGFVTIPFMSLLAFTVISVSMILLIKQKEHHES